MEGRPPTLRSAIYMRVYNEAYARHYNQLSSPLPFYTAEARLRNEQSLASVCDLLASSEALRAETDARRRASNSSLASAGGSTSSTRPSASYTPSAAYNPYPTHYTPSATFGTPYPTTRAPTEWDLRSQSYWHQRDYNRMHNAWREEDRRYDWNRGR